MRLYFLLVIIDQNQKTMLSRHTMIFQMNKVLMMIKSLKTRQFENEKSIIVTMSKEKIIHNKDENIMYNIKIMDV